MFNNTINDKNTTKGIPLGPTPHNVGITAFNISTIQRLLDSKGIVAFHIKHAYDPKTQRLGGNIEDQNINFVFYDIRPVRVVAQQMDAQTHLMQYSIDQLNTKVMMNVGGYYLDNTTENERVLIRPNDIIILNPSVTIGNQDIVHVKEGNVIKLQQYVTKVDFLMDDAGKKYNPATEISVDDGKIILQKSVTDKNFSIVYEHPVMYNVDSMSHYIRILQSNDSGHGSATREASYAPQLMFGSFIQTSNFGDKIYDWFRSETVSNYEQFLSKGKYV